MSKKIRIQLRPVGTTLEVVRGTPLRDVLFTHGVEFPCGGQGRCGRCRIRLAEGELPVTHEEEDVLTREELAEGWRLACRSKAANSVTIDLDQWQAVILADNSLVEFTPREGLGVAIDLGTTTLAGQLLNLRTGSVMSVRTALNAQASYGGDIMSRVRFAVVEKGQQKLESLIRNQVGSLIHELIAASKHDRAPISDIVIVGNTVMHHLFCGITVEPLAHYPFEPPRPGLEIIHSADLGWKLPGNPAVRFLPCLGGFVGSDILAGVLATRLHASGQLNALVDLGTNGEIVIGNCSRMLCASTAAGPAFEGSEISTGMRAQTGAISEVSSAEGHLRCHVLGNVKARGICGSGLVDAVATCLELGLILPSGHLANDATGLTLCPPVTLTQDDIRKVQLAKAAVAAGIRILLDKWGSAKEDLVRLYVAGAFGNYINRASARRIGLIDLPPEKLHPAGNTALAGAKAALLQSDGEDGSYTDLRRRVEHVPLNAERRFQEYFVQEIPFPGPSCTEEACLLKSDLL